MKKFCKIITVIMAMAMFILTPGVSAVSHCLTKLAPATSETYQYTAPTQSRALFDSDSTTYDLATWSKPSTSDYLVAEQVTSETNAKFHEQYPHNSLSNILSRSPFVILNKTLNVPTNGGYSTNEITLSANSYYLVSVDYYVLEQANQEDDIENIAFGTFYLNDEAITLFPQNKGWDTATYYITTDKLATATVTPKLFFGSEQVFGSEQEKAIGAIYFDNFNVTAVSHSVFESELADRNSSNSHFIDFTHKNDILKIAEFTNDDFTPTTTATNADSYKNISTANIPSNLGFEDEQNYFYHKDGETKNVMLMKAHNSNTGLSLEDYTLKTNPHEVYMFQFYSIATSTADFKFCFMIGNNAQEISNLVEYPHYNGWQLNTIFFIAGQELNKEYKLKFTLGNNGSTTGWACIDELKIYKVNGSYATENATAVGVHDTNDQNANSVALDIANGNFDLGRSADTVNIPYSSYPYPLTAESWTTDSNTNGIINTALWDDRFGNTNPGAININYTENNHVYMMHNNQVTENIFTSPALTTTVGSTTYISFDAYSTTTTQTRAYILTAETDEEENLINEIILPEIIDINDGEWHRYEFAITENEFATSRKYYLRFVMNGVGYAYIDNVRTSQKAASNQTTTAIVDLNNTLTFDSAWQSVDEFATYTSNATSTGVTLEIFNQPKTVLQNAFSYNLTANEYFEIVIEARGNNAYLGLSNYDGLLEVITDEVDENLNLEYKLYLQPKTDATTVNLQVTLGNIDADTNDQINPTADGNIFIKSLKITKISEDAFKLASAGADTGSRMKILSVSDKNEDESENDANNGIDNNLFGENWWYLIPSLITALALLLGIIAFLLRKIKFDKHITKKTTSYARDMRLKNQQNKIVAQKAAKVDNITDEKQDN